MSQAMYHFDFLNRLNVLRIIKTKIADNLVSNFLFDLDLLTATLGNLGRGSIDVGLSNIRFDSENAVHYIKFCLSLRVNQRAHTYEPFQNNCFFISKFYLEGS